MKYFGTDGFRGEAGVTLTAEHAFKIGRYIGSHYQDGKHRVKIVIGKDTRLSGYMYETALAAGITASGADVYEMHVTTTPSISYFIRTDHFDAGIMITASHNPYMDNGIKILNGAGEKLEESVELEIEDFIDGKGKVPAYATGDALGRCFDYTIGREKYKQFLMDTVQHSFEGVKVCLDMANGASTGMATDIFERLGATVYTMGDGPDGMNINRHCGSTRLHHLQKFVLDKGADVGFAYDGDADRCLAVDEKGQEITGDHILYLCGLHMKEKGKLAKNTVVTTVMANMGLYKAFDAAGISYEQTPVGDKYVSANMRDNGYVLGGEQSGHIIFQAYATTGDGILTSLQIMDVLCEKKQPLSELVAELTIYPQLLENVRVKDKIAAREDSEVKDAAQKVAKELGSRGRLLLRESGTEPLIRVMVEAESYDLCKKYVDEIVMVLRNRGHEVPR